MAIATDRTINTEAQTSIQSDLPEPFPRKTIGIPREQAGECRVAATPETVQVLQKYGFDVLVETQAGSAASFSDEAYRRVNCRMVESAQALWSTADIVLKVRPPQVEEVGWLKPGATLISFIWPQQHPELVQALADRRATVLAMESVPRISRAQKMDALSSMANVAGYRAVLEAAHQFGRFFPGQITAAGKVPPAKILVIGAGVAGLAAIGAAQSLGAIVRAFDTRSVVKEQVQSLGAEFLEVTLQEDGAGQGGYAKEMSPAFIEAEMALFAAQAREVDIIITTALIPGRPAPKLITRSMVEAMKPGSVIVDLAAEQGGNCDCTQPGQVAQHHGVTIVGLTDLPSRMAPQASQLYGTNLCHLLDELGRNDHYQIDLEDEVIRGALLLHDGDRVEPLPPRPVSVPAATTTPTQPETAVSTQSDMVHPRRSGWLWAIAGAMALTVGLLAPASFLSHLTVFVLACFIGWQVIWNVKPALHTPLMSVTNAISGIIILGGMLQVSDRMTDMTTILGAIAILIGSINIAGGFWVTQRMLNMFHK